MSRPEWIYGPSGTIAQKAVPIGPPFARYLTVGGATVELAKVVGYGDSDRLTHTRAVCTGCNALHAIEWLYQGDYTQLRDEDGQRATPQVRDWAQDHASTCRAMPKRPKDADDFGDGAW